MEPKSNVGYLIGIQDKSGYTGTKIKWIMMQRKSNKDGMISD